MSSPDDGTADLLYKNNLFTSAVLGVHCCVGSSLVAGVGALFLLQ